MRQFGIAPTGIMGRQNQIARNCRHFRKRDSFNLSFGVVFPHLHFTLKSEDDLTVLITASGLNVDHAAIRFARRGLHPNDSSLNLYSVTNVHWCAEAHIAVL